MCSTPPRGSIGGFEMTTNTNFAQVGTHRQKPFPFSLKQRLYLIAEAIGIKTSLLLLVLLLAALTAALIQVTHAQEVFSVAPLQELNLKPKSR